MLFRLLLIIISVLLLPSTFAQSLDREALAAAIAAPGRDIAERLRDPVRKPVDVLDFLGVETGMRVLDLYAAEGYYTFVLSKAVGPTGTVFAQNSPDGFSYEEQGNGTSAADTLARRIETEGLDNVEPLPRPALALGLPAESVDFVLLSQILHDYFNGSPQRALAILESLHSVLKPGGVLGIIDHAGDAGQNNARMHRMPVADAIRILEEAGFVVEAQSALLANPQDNHRRSIFDPLLNRQSDQFLLRARKPGS